MDVDTYFLRNLTEDNNKLINIWPETLSWINLLAPITMFLSDNNNRINKLQIKKKQKTFVILVKYNSIDFCI